MKKYIALCCVLSGMLFGCNESKFLREVPEDFMSAENSYETEADFDMSVNDLYSLVREECMVMMNGAPLTIYMERI